MGRSPGLALYLLATAWPGAGAVEPAERPDGPLVWMHLGSDARSRPALELARRIRHALDDCTVLVTSETGFSGAEPERGLVFASAPAPRVPATRAFLDTWTPDVLLMVGPETDAAHVVEAWNRGLAVFWIDADPAERAPGWLRFTPGARASLAQHFTAILPVSEEAAETLNRFGAPTTLLDARGRLEEDAVPLACNEGERDALADLLQARPVWLAVHLPRTELQFVETAHTEAQRLSHRLLLIIVPKAPEDGPGMRVMLEAEGWQTALRSDGGEPEADVQVYIADTPGELGLWYRLAPVTYVGGTLDPNLDAGDPFEAAALGSAIVSGPEDAPHAEAFQRLRRAGAARRVPGGRGLGAVVGELLAPDRAAEMARRAWDVSSSGAAITDRVIELVSDALDRRGAR